ncbi:MAG: glycosyltransferase [Nanoarchaeota archaeon]
MIAKNEELFLETCLDSIKDSVDEIIVVDTGSTDKTKEIAKRFHAKVIDFKWMDDFSAARNESLNHATKDWILALDADEVIEGKDLKKIKDLVRDPQDNVGFALEQRSYIYKYFEGAVENNLDFYLVKQYPFYIRNCLVRLFKNHLGLHFKHRVHELIEDSIVEKNFKFKKSEIILHHFGSVKNEANVLGKSEQYSRIILKQLEECPESDRYNYQAGKMCLGRNDFMGALKFFGKTAKINSNYKLVFSEIGKIYLQMNDSNRAAEYFKKSMKFNPDNPSPANNLAVAYMSIGKFDKAKVLLEEQLRKHPGNKALIYNYKKALENL